MKNIFLFAIWLFAFSLSAQTYKKRLALVVGNATYEHGGSLKNAVNDAQAMARKLQALGFEVWEYENVDQRQLKQAINQFGQKLRDFEVGLFYYAGHGIQHKGLNFMVPVEANLQTAEQIEFDCVAADRVLAFMETAQTKVNVIIMDACRNNPFERSWHRSGNGSGLAVMDSPAGTLIAYATAPGRVADDGPDANGLYTSALLTYLGNPDLTIEQVFKKVRTEVAEKSKGAQIPWETTSLTGDDFYFSVKNISTGTLSKVATSTNTTSISNRGSSGTTSAAAREKAKTWITEGHAVYNTGNYQGAIVKYDEAIRSDPYSDDAYYWRASAMYGLKQYQEALPYYDKALEINPNKEQAYYYRALSRYNIKQYAESIPDFNKAIELNPDVSAMYYWRGETEYVLKLYPEAILDLTRALELNSRDGYAYKARANSYYMLEKYDEALVDYTRAMELNQDDNSLYYWRGICQYYTERYNACVSDFKRYLETVPHDAYSKVMIGHSYYMLENYTEAISFYTSAIGEDSGYALAFFWRGNAWMKLGKASEALRDVNEAIRLDPQNQTYLDYKAGNF